ncbi:MAG TPA: hypothetical protein VFM49_03315 [Chloroflexia bacterium]|nr:hypothetical protein [Chloroflexia bacterium]
MVVAERQSPEPRVRAPGRSDLALGLGRVGVVLGLVPWLFIIPLAWYQMTFMLWTWIWPALLACGGILAAVLAWRLHDPRAARLVRAAFGLSLLSLLTALAGFVWMVAGMTHAMPGMPM